MIHAVSLLVGTMIISFGLGTGLMYLVQSYRLKHKLKSHRGFRLPSLEYLQWLNRLSLFISFADADGGPALGHRIEFESRRTYRLVQRWHHLYICPMRLVGRGGDSGADQLPRLRW